MDRRLIIVIGVSLLCAFAVTSVVRQMTAGASSGSRSDQALTDVVIASRPLPIGITIKSGDVRVQKMPASQFPKGAFSKPEEVFERSVISNILAEEPILDGRLAVRGSGLGLAAVIPVGMRAVAVRVSDVTSVSGFVLPGMRVDVQVTGRPPSGDAGSVTTTVLQNISVLSAGTTVQPGDRGQAINAQTVTLLVTPDQAEILTLASNEGKIQLSLRNTADKTIEKTPGRDLYELYGGKGKKRDPDADKPRVVVRRAAPKPVAVVAPPPLPPPPPPQPEVVIIRGNSKSVETVSAVHTK